MEENPQPPARPSREAPLGRPVSLSKSKIISGAHKHNTVHNIPPQQPSDIPSMSHSSSISDLTPSKSTKSQQPSDIPSMSHSSSISYLTPSKSTKSQQPSDIPSMPHSSSISDLTPSNSTDDHIQSAPKKWLKSKSSIPDIPQNNVSPSRSLSEVPTLDVPPPLPSDVPPPLPSDVPPPLPSDVPPPLPSDVPPTLPSDTPLPLVTGAIGEIGEIFQFSPREIQRQKEYFTLMKRQDKYFVGVNLGNLWPVIKNYHCFLFLIRTNEQSNNLVADIIKSITENKLEIIIIDVQPEEFGEVMEHFMKNGVLLDMARFRLLIIDLRKVEDGESLAKMAASLTEITNSAQKYTNDAPMLIYAPHIAKVDRDYPWKKRCTFNTTGIKGFCQTNVLFWFGEEPQQESMEYFENIGTALVIVSDPLASFSSLQKELFNKNPNLRFVINMTKPEDKNSVEKILSSLRLTCGFTSPVLLYCATGLEPSDDIYDKYERVWVTGHSRQSVLHTYSCMFVLQWAPDLRLGDAMQGKTSWSGTVTIVDIITRDLLPYKGDSSSPFVELSINGKKKSKTDVQLNNSSPRWMGINWSFPCSSTDIFDFDIYHKKKSEEGKIKIQISEVLVMASMESPFLTKTWKLKPIKKVTNVKGTITLTMAFNPSMAALKKNQHFGVPLKESIHNARAKNQPHAVEAILDQLYERGLDLEGIARIPGDSMNVNRIVNLIDSGLLSFSLSREDPFVLMGVLKKYIELLPDRLMSEAMYEKICSLELNEGDVPEVKQLFDLDDSDRRKLASDMFRLCYAITQHSSQNRMDIRAVSTAFPILVVPHAIQKDPMRYMSAMQKVPLIIMFFLKYGHQIWGWTEPK